MDLKHYIRDVPDFPEPGVLFRDITPLLQSHEALREVLSVMEAQAMEFAPTTIVAIESRGFIFGVPLALALELPFVPIRKPGKLPAARMSVEYALEYGKGQLDIHLDAIHAGDRAVVVDDVLATGGTARAAATLVERLGGVVAGYCFLAEIEALEGRKQLDGYNIRSQMVF